MARPKLKYKIQRNGDSIKYFEDGEYIGSISLKKLGVIIRRQRLIDPRAITTQES